VQNDTFAFFLSFCPQAPSLYAATLLLLPHIRAKIRLLLKEGECRDAYASPIFQIIRDDKEKQVRAWSMRCGLSVPFAWSNAARLAFSGEWENEIK
jgi:hypothetical protein